MPMPRQVVKLSDFDPEPLIEYAITDVDLQNVYFYLQAMQAHLTSGTWADIGLGGYYGTSALLHEVVEVRILLNRDRYLLTRTASEVKAFARHKRNADAHIRGLEAEYRYLQSVILRVFSQRVDIGALLQANSRRPGDWHALFETDLPFFEPSEGDIHEAEVILARLRTVNRSSL
jgi:hypothetical protein